MSTPPSDLPQPHPPRATTLTVITPLDRSGPLLLLAQFALTKRIPSLKGLQSFKSVYFSRWSVVRRFAYLGAPQTRERPSQPWLLWEVVFSAEVDPYIESFVHGIYPNIQRIWGSSYGFPKVQSTKAVTDYIHGFAWQETYDYYAYPEASVRIVLSALEIAKEHTFLMDAARSSRPSEFAETYRGFLRRRGGDL